MGKYFILTKSVLIMTILLLFQHEAKAQLTTLTLQPGSTGIDANVSSRSSSTNFGTATTLSASRNAAAFPTDTSRSYIKFDLSTIPANAVIYEAKLYLYGVSHSLGNNACFLERVSATWGETTVNWANKPSSTATGQHAIAGTTNTTKDDTVDVTTDVQNMYAVPSGNFGWILRLQSQSVLGARRQYASSDNATSSLWPKLVVKYYFPMTLNPVVTSYPCSGGTNIGAIDLSVSNGVPPYTYSWSPGGATTQDISSLARGTYSVTVTDALSNVKTISVGVGYQQVWTYFSSMTTSGDTLVQAYGSNNWFNNGSSINRLAAGTDGWVEYTVQSTTLDKTFGLADTNTIPGLNDIDYGVYIKNAASNNLIRIENTVQTVIGTYKIGDVIRIERVGSNIYYKQNGTILSTKTGANTGALYTETAIWTNGGKFKNIRTSFPISGIYYWAGTASSDWHSDSNWSACTGVPTSNKDVIIPQGAAHMPVISAEEVCRNIMIGPSATLTINSGKTLSVYGNFTNNGTFTSTSGTVAFTGSVNQSISTSAASLAVYSLSLNKPSGNVTMSKPVSVGSSLGLTKGQLVSTATNLLTLNDNVTVSGGSDSGYVSGPVKKVGNDAFTFPLGSTTLSTAAYHPLTITAPSVTTDAFTAEYISGKYSGTALADSIAEVDTCEYWKVARVAGTSDINATLNWSINNCRTDDFDDVTIVNWNGSEWIDRGASARVGSNTTAGSLTSDIFLSLSSIPQPIAIGRRRFKPVYFPVEEWVDGAYHRTYGKKLYIKYDEKYRDGILKYAVYNSQHTAINTSSITVNKNYGLNWLTIDLSTASGMSTGSFYTLEVENDKGQKEYLRFKFQ